MQILTTADYATQSLLWNFITGGLDNQVIHHLVPVYVWVLSVCYRDLAPIVRDTCVEFGAVSLLY